MSTPSTPVHTVEEPGMATVPGQGLVATDRCDRCGAQAYVRTSHNGHDLFWCAHHYGANEDALDPHKTLDERHQLRQ